MLWCHLWFALAAPVWWQIRMRLKWMLTAHPTWWCRYVPTISYGTTVCVTANVWQAQVYSYANNWIKILRFIGPHFPWEMGLGVHGSERVITQTSNGGVGRCVGRWKKAFVLFIHSSNEELCWDPGQVVLQAHTWTIFTMVRKKFRWLLKWNLKSKSTTHCGNTLYSQSTGLGTQ